MDHKEIFTDIHQKVHSNCIQLELITAPFKQVTPNTVVVVVDVHKMCHFITLLKKCQQIRRRWISVNMGMNFFRELMAVVSGIMWDR